jgi:hypothetical protein
MDVTTEQGRMRLVAVVALAAVVTLLAVGLGWPSNAVPSPMAPITVHVTQVTWNVTGCGVGDAIEPGLVVVGGGNFSVDRNVTLPGNATGCRVVSVGLNSAGFTLLGWDAPAAAPGTTVEWSLRVGAPDRYLTAPLGVSVVAGAGP